jgi:hypothetical protein
VTNFAQAVKGHGAGRRVARFALIQPAKATGAAREIKAVQFSKIVLETLLLIAYHINEFR